jgi:hypothetical protein
MGGGDRFWPGVAAQTRRVRQGSVGQNAEASSSRADAQKHIGQGRCADSTWLSTVGVTRRGAPTQSLHISVLLHLRRFVR